ncbi:MAG: radical SAM protein [Methanotrichaceae archaeon]
MLIIAWETTSACNLQCSYCRASAKLTPEPDELSASEALAFIDEIAALQPMIILSGGEPLLRPDIFLLAKHAFDKGLRTSLATNGTLLSPEIVDKIAASGIKRVSISLDGPNSKAHDATRGSGCFIQAMKGIDNLQGKIDFQINTTITRRNRDNILSMFDLAENVGAKALHFFFLVPTGRGREEDLISSVQQEEILRMIDKESSRRPIEIQVTCAPQYARISKAKEGPKLKEGLELMDEPRVKDGRRRKGGCLAGRSFVFISRRGEVYPCGYLPILAGSIREKSFIEIWENSPIFKSLKDRELKGKCGQCGYTKICGGCRARAYAKTGDYLESDPLCPEAV